MKKRLHEIVFEADTPEGKLFDLTLLLAILLSVIGVMLESVTWIKHSYGDVLVMFEWGFTLLFTLEYALRIWLSNKSFSYALSFFGIVDLLSILPSFIGIFISGGMGSLMIIRAFRLIRVFRVLKLTRYISGSNQLVETLKESRSKIIVFLTLVGILVMIMGSVMYLVEGGQNGFTSIPRSIYWAIVTVTTVGYGDISPVTVLGQALSSVLMIVGYCIVAVPSGIIAADFMATKKVNVNSQVCDNCFFDRHDDDALYCKRCGNGL